LEGSVDRTNVFISYRRQSSGLVRALYGRLVAELGADAVFRDHESLPGAAPVRSSIEDGIRRSDVVLVVIGSRWAELFGERDAADDLLRDEIVQTLALGKRLLPVLLEDAAMPAAAQLPPDVAPITDANAVRLRDSDFDHDIDRILDVLGIGSRTRAAAPRFATDRIDGNVIGFTVTNPPGAPSVRITDVEIIPGAGRELHAAIETRFRLADAVLASRAEAGKYRVFGDVTRGRSVFAEDGVIRLDDNDAAAFTLAVFAMETYVYNEFVLRVVYVDEFGDVRRLSSDGLYRAHTGYGVPEVHAIERTSLDEIRQQLLEHDCTALMNLALFQETDFAGLDLFELIMTAEATGRCGYRSLSMIEQLNQYTMNGRRLDAMLKRVEELDDLADFDVKYFYLVNLIAHHDRRAVPHANGLLSKFERRRDMRWRAGGTAYLALLGLKEALAAEWTAGD
jgi:hypothetical protein